MSEATKLFTERRSINFFDPAKDVPEEKIREIVELAVLAPSAFNLQPWKLIAVRTPEAKKKLRSVAFDQPKIEEAPWTFIVLADKEGYGADNPEWAAKLQAFGPAAAEQVEGYKQFAGMLYGTSDFRKYKFAESNAGLLAMSLMYAAQEFGVESHAMSGMDFDGVKAAFGIADRYEVSMLISFGYLAPDKELYPRMARFGFDAITTVV